MTLVQWTAQSAPPSPSILTSCYCVEGSQQASSSTGTLPTPSWCRPQSKEAYFNVVTAFSITPCGLKGVSCGRDAVCVVWDLT